MHLNFHQLFAFKFMIIKHEHKHSNTLLSFAFGGPSLRPVSNGMDLKTLYVGTKQEKTRMEWEWDKNSHAKTVKQIYYTYLSLIFYQSTYNGLVVSSLASISTYIWHACIVHIYPQHPRGARCSYNRSQIWQFPILNGSPETNPARISTWSPPHRLPQRHNHAFPLIGFKRF